MSGVHQKTMILICSLTILGLFSCSTGGGDGADDATVYVSGFYKDGGNHIPCYWKNGSRIALDVPSGTIDAAAKSIFVSGDTVYAAGYYMDNITSVPCYWTGTTRTDLPCGINSGEALSIYVSGGTVYVTGYYMDGVIDVPCYWNEGLKTDVNLPAGMSSGGTNSIYFVSSGEVYTAGSYLDPAPPAPPAHAVACYWDGHDRNNLTIPIGASSSCAYGVIVSDAVIYASGCYDSGGDTIPCTWTGTSRTDLDLPQGVDEGYPISMAVSKSVISSAGYYINSASRDCACYWVGAARTDLPGGSGDAKAFSICVSGDKVYTAGYSHGTNGTVACYWNGNDRTVLHEEYSEAYSIFVVE